MNDKVMKIIKIAVPLASIGLTIVGNMLSKQEFKENVAKEVAKALAEADKN